MQGTGKLVLRAKRQTATKYPGLTITNQPMATGAPFSSRILLPCA